MVTVVDLRTRDRDRPDPAWRSNPDTIECHPDGARALRDLRRAQGVGGRPARRRLSRKVRVGSAAPVHLAVTAGARVPTSRTPAVRSDHRWRMPSATAAVRTIKSAAGSAGSPSPQTAASPSWPPGRRSRKAIVVKTSTGRRSSASRPRRARPVAISVAGGRIYTASERARHGQLRERLHLPPPARTPTRRPRASPAWAAQPGLGVIVGTPGPDS